MHMKSRPQPLYRHFWISSLFSPKLKEVREIKLEPKSDPYFQSFQDMHDTLVLFQIFNKFWPVNIFSILFPQVLASW